MNKAALLIAITITAFLASSCTTELKYRTEQTEQKLYVTGVVSDTLIYIYVNHTTFFLDDNADSESLDDAAVTLTVGSNTYDSIPYNDSWSRFELALDSPLAPGSVAQLSVSHPDYKPITSSLVIHPPLKVRLVDSIPVTLAFPELTLELDYPSEVEAICQLFITAQASFSYTLNDSTYYDTIYTSNCFHTNDNFLLQLYSEYQTSSNGFGGFDDIYDRDFAPARVPGKTEISRFTPEFSTKRLPSQPYRLTIQPSLQYPEFLDYYGADIHEWISVKVSAVTLSYERERFDMTEYDDDPFTSIFIEPVQQYTNIAGGFGIFHQSNMTDTIMVNIHKIRK